jgi:hypothetical protein
MMFDLRKFWLGTTVYVLIIGVVIASACVGFNALIGMPTKETYQQTVTQTEATRGWSGKATPVEINRKSAAPATVPLSPNVQPAPAANIAVAMTPPRIPVPEIQIIVPERKPTRAAGRIRSGF